MNELVFTIVVVVDGKDNRVHEDEQDDKVLEQGRGCEVYNLYADWVLGVQAVQRLRIIDKSFRRDIGAALGAATAPQDVVLFTFEDAFNKVWCLILLILIYDSLHLVGFVLIIGRAFDRY